MRTKSMRIATAATCLIIISLAAIYWTDPSWRRTESRMRERGEKVAEDYMLSSLNVTDIEQDNDGLMWIGTSAGINIYDGDSYLQLAHDADDPTALPDDYINALLCDGRGRMWVATQNGLARNDGAYSFRRFSLPTRNQNITALRNDRNGGILATNGERVWRISGDNVESTDIKPFGKQTDRLHNGDSLMLKKPKEMIADVYRDGEGNRWVGYRNAGYQVISDALSRYERANDNALAKATRGMDITFMTAMGRYVVAGTMMRTFVYDTVGGCCQMTTLKETTGRNRTVTRAIPIDDRRLWLVADDIIMLCRIEGGRLQAEKEAYCAANGERIGGAAAYGNSLYAASSKGWLLECRTEAGRDCETKRIGISERGFSDETQLEKMQNGKMLLFLKGLRLAEFDIKTKKTKVIADNSEKGRKDYIDPAFAHCDSKGMLWLGTKRYGLYRHDLRNGKTERIDFLGDPHIQAMQEDMEHRLWITTLRDAIVYEPESGNVAMYALASATQSERQLQYFDNAICMTQSGEVVMGSSDGCRFVPHSTAANRNGKGIAEKAKGLRIYDIAVRRGDATEASIALTDDNEEDITLSHDENTLRLAFFYPDYSGTSALMYQYRLEGYDKEWHPMTYKHTAEYSNLPAGRYKFRVRLFLSVNSRPLAERTIGVRIKSAPWLSSAAMVTYLAIILLLIYYINHLYLSIRTGRMRILQEHREKEREQRTNEMNMSFFANIAHEFRNPITLIAGPLMQLEKRGDIPAPVRHTLNIIGISANRMLRLIDQMLDFNQLEADALRLKVGLTDAAETIRRQTAAMRESAKVRNVSVELLMGSERMEAWTDSDKLEKILSNLFTNALKHTPEGGKIIVRAEIKRTPERADLLHTDNQTIKQEIKQKLNAANYICVDVYNSNSHIEEGKEEDVFKRYYQLKETGAGHHYGWGSGIGLYYVKRLVTLHHGCIRAFNTECPQGVTFSFSLPADRQAYVEREMTDEKGGTMQIPVYANSADNENDNTYNAECDMTTSAQEATGMEGQMKKILVVDDDTDVAAYIKSIFSNAYRVEMRHSAEEALRDMERIMPDIVLSDVVMGEMSGFDLCREMKGNLMLSHIPVVMITAKSEMKEQISGLRLGAVAYVTKPFDPNYLQATVEAQLKNIDSLRHRLGEATDTNDIGDELSDEDRRFMDELYGYMEKRAAEMELNVQTVCRDLLISQSKFNYKLKELTGDTPGVFFRKYKLNKAARMLREGKMSVAEIAMLTGFSTTAHFTVAFKKQFGAKPSEYGKKP